MSIRQGDVLPAAVLANQTLGKMLERAANRDRGIVLCCWGDRLDFLSYKDLLLAASCVLRGLRQNGLQPQDKIILQLKNPRNFFISLWACWLGGFIPIPLGVEPTRKDLSPSKLHQTWELCDRPVIIGDSLNPDFSNVLSIEELLNNSGDRNYHRADLADLALLIFTSGSTGKPKGVMLSGRNLVASVYGMAKVNNLSPQDITLNWMPLEHIASLVMFHLTEVYLGCEQIQVDSELILRNPLNWLNLIDKHRVTATWSPNFAYNLVNEKLESGVDYGWDLSCLRWLGNGAEAVVGKTAGRFIELLAPYGLSAAAVSPGYGMSETTSGIAHSHNFDRRRQKDFVSVGEPIPGVSLRIVNSDNEIVPQGEVGLLQVRGETITAGYYLQPELNQEVFIDGWFNTGDLGFIEQGQLTITGRQKDVIVINGANYYNQDIETAVESISGVTVSFTAACSVTDGRQQEQVAVFFHTEKKAGSLRTLINEIRKSVFAEVGVSPAYIIPVAQETIPKTAIGKIMRSQLAQRFNAGEFEDRVAEIAKLLEQRDLAPQELPSSAIEQRLVKIWREVLNLKQVGVKDNFFELGGNSLLLMEVASKLSAYGISATNLFQYPTISTLAEYIQNGDRESIAAQQGKRRGELRRQAGNKDVAIIGMSCRFPGANNLEEFWQNLCNGVESISFFSDAEIINSGVDRELINHPDYVKASPILEDIEGFDADFWGFTPKEAQLLDPQQRLFLECAWESLEDAGYDSFTYSGDISLYGGAATNTYLLNNIYPNRDRLDEQNSLQVLNLSSMGGFQVSTANDKDYLTTRTSYKLNLTGSSVNVQTACSTSLVTVHLACQSLIDAECDMALAGGVSVHSPQKMGYLYQEGTIFSQDGHCRAFDADASGTIFGSGAGMVVLKLLDRAIEDGDRIYGVIKGSAVNNDGGTKVGYLAPSVDGQTRVIAEALAVADIAPDTVSYIEAHGTGTKLGDPIEVKALSQAYQQDIKKRDLCGIGSVKTNVGHLQMASGIVGLIKTVLCLYRQQIPASLHCDRPNPQLNLERTSFYINTKLQNWQSPSLPRRAGVNSLGIGGTNAHVILEEFIESKQPASNELPAYLLTLSAKNETALQNLADKYREFLAAEACSEISLRDICFTSNIGRHHFDYRYGAVAKDKQDLINQLSNISAATVGDKNQIAFLFTGQGSQYVGMAQQLYHTCKIFQSNCDRCLEILQPYIDLTAAKIFSETPSPCCDINKTQYTQPLLF
ncbi:MAG: beta-ketoacyl synthase N-terminal-like domain-containing protein, partial [Cyanobacteria bacterium P01_G01_bin.19]